jgi:hypothetical protein
MAMVRSFIAGLSLSKRLFRDTWELALIGIRISASSASDVADETEPLVSPANVTEAKYGRISHGFHGRD